MKRHLTFILFSSLTVALAAHGCSVDTPETDDEADTTTTTTSTSVTTTAATTVATVGAGGMGVGGTATGGMATGGTSGMCVCDSAAIGGCVDEDLTQCVCEACDTDTTCDLSEDCVCPDCAADSFCTDPANCDGNGLCNPYLEGCGCADCADNPICPGGATTCEGMGTGGAGGAGGGGVGGGTTSGGGGPPAIIPATCEEAHGVTGCCAGDDLYYWEMGMLQGPFTCNPGTCGWDMGNSWYACGTSGMGDPTNLYPLSCGLPEPDPNDCP